MHSAKPVVIELAANMMVYPLLQTLFAGEGLLSPKIPLLIR
jgi:hypothetical protein